MVFVACMQYIMLLINCVCTKPRYNGLPRSLIQTIAVASHPTFKVIVGLLNYCTNNLLYLSYIWIVANVKFKLIKTGVHWCHYPRTLMCLGRCANITENWWYVDKYAEILESNYPQYEDDQWESRYNFYRDQQTDLYEMEKYEILIKRVHDTWRDWGCPRKASWTSTTR